MADQSPGTTRFAAGFAILLAFAIPFYDIEDFLTIGFGNIAVDLGLTFMIVYLTYLVHGLLRLSGNSTGKSSFGFFVLLWLVSFPLPYYSLVPYTSTTEAFAYDFVIMVFFLLILYAFTRANHGAKYVLLFFIINIQILLYLLATVSFNRTANLVNQEGPSSTSGAIIFLGLFFFLIAYIISRRQLRAIRRIGSGGVHYGTGSAFANQASAQQGEFISPPSADGPEEEEEEPEFSPPKPGPAVNQATTSNLAAPASYGSEVQYDKNSNTVAVIGYTGGGKTTLITLFVYAAGFINEIPGYSFTPESVSPVLRDSMKSMLSGEWPAGTLVGELRTQTSMTLSRKAGFRTKKVDLRLNDASGETWTKLAEEGETPEALKTLLGSLPQVRYLAWTSQYIVTIDCETYENWVTEQFYYLNIFKSLYFLNGKKKVKKPVGLVFTKFDRLPEEAQNTSLQTLLKRDLSHLYQYLNSHFTLSNIRLFSIGVAVTDDNKPIVNLVNGRKSLSIIGGGPFGQLPEIVKWLLED